MIPILAESPQNYGYQQAPQQTVAVRSQEPGYQSFVQIQPEHSEYLCPGQRQMTSTAVEPEVALMTQQEQIIKDYYVYHPPHQGSDRIQSQDTGLPVNYVRMELNQPTPLPPKKEESVDTDKKESSLVQYTSVKLYHAEFLHLT